MLVFCTLAGTEFGRTSSWRIWGGDIISGLPAWGDCACVVYEICPRESSRRSVGGEGSVGDCS